MLLKSISKIIKLAIICLFLIFTVLFHSCRQSEDEQSDEKAIPVMVTNPESVKMSFPIRTTGILSSKAEMKLSFKTGGIIEKIYIEGKLYFPWFSFINLRIQIEGIP